MKETWRTAEAWHREVREAIGKGVASVAVETQDWRGHTEKMRFDIGLSMKGDEERLLVKVQPRCSRRPQHFGDASTMGCPPRTATAVAGRRPLEPRGQAVCAAEGRAIEVTQAPWRSPEDGEWIPEFGHRVIYNVSVWGCFVQTVTMPWFFSLEVRKKLTYFLFYRRPQLNNFELLKRFLDFNRDFFFKDWILSIWICKDVLSP